MPRHTIGAMLTGNAVRVERGRLRMTQHELADALGVSKRTVQVWEALGAEQVPLGHQARLAELFGATAPSNAADMLSTVSDLALIAELTRRLAGRSVTNQTRSVTVANGGATDAAVNVDADAVDTGVVGSLEPIQRNPGSGSDGRRSAYS